ncbi:MAG TPA: DUF4352 domain-containing protein [Dehalococcoidia bacterium]|nr:DUF4352 domain-containing protein [Dehalococcoidia bacterium]
MNKKGAAAALISFLIILVAFGASFACGEVLPATTEYYQIGERVQTSTEMLTVLSVERTNIYKRSGAGAILRTKVYPPPTTLFIIVEVTVINVGKDKYSISPDDFTLTDLAGHEYAYTDYEGRDPYRGMGLDPGATTHGYILYIVPEEITEFELSCTIHGTPPILAVWELEW